VADQHHANAEEYSDLDLHEAVHDAIYDLDYVRESEVVVHVNVLNGEAELKGVVLTRIMHRAVVQAASSVPGIKKVIDNLVTDSDIEIGVGQAMWKELGAPAAQISANSYRGEVMLVSDSVSAEVIQKAAESAGKVPGVVRVTTRLVQAAG
jgi:osmotically-inducible protein OsmY